MAALLLLGLLIFSVGSVESADMMLTTAGAPGAPIDAQKAQRDPYVSLSNAQKKDMVREFKALLSLGLQPTPYGTWAGRDMGDCRAEQGAPECHVQMGMTEGRYRFHKAGDSGRIQEIAVVVDTGDTSLLKELRPAARAYVGHSGQFYLDENEQTGDSKIRFQYNR